ncbi:hypothetical protein DENSPDRAFT_886132 [Dentipellis sp. KUC8613]|nr:hypothetical protein DENSPDRAFT_886132 [Dentipellis sp. KUC8613]
MPVCREAVTRTWQRCGGTRWAKRGREVRNEAREGREGVLTCPPPPSLVLSSRAGCRHALSLALRPPSRAQRRPHAPHCTRLPPSHAPRALSCPPPPSVASTAAVTHALVPRGLPSRALCHPAPTVLRPTLPSCAPLLLPHARGHGHVPAALFRPARAVSRSTLPSCAPPPPSHTHCPLVPRAPSVVFTATPARVLEPRVPPSHAPSSPARAVSRPTSPSCAAPLLSHARRPLGPRALSVASTATVTRHVALNATVSCPMPPLCTPPPPSHVPMSPVRVPTPPSRIP